MTTGYYYYFKKLTLVDFGDENINRSETFTQSTNCSRDPMVFEAIRSLFDPKYLNDKVTKPGKTRGRESYVELTYEWNGCEHKIKRKFGKNGCMFVDGKVEKRIPDLLTIQREKQMRWDTPTNITDRMMSQMFRQLMDQQKKLNFLIEYLRWCVENNRKAIILETLDDIPGNIESDLKLNLQIKRLIWKWNMSQQNRRRPADDEHYREMTKLFPPNPMDEYDFRNSFVDISLASLQFNIAANQRDFYDRSIKEIDRENEYYGNEIPLPSGLEGMLKAIEASKMLQQHHNELLDFYNENLNVVAKYKEGFSTAHAWQMEKQNIETDILEETQFFDDLTIEEGLPPTDFRSEISDIVIAIKEQENQMGMYDPDVLGVINKLKPYIMDNVMASLNEFCENLCEILNSPMLEVASVADIAGSVQYITSSVQNITNNGGAAIKPEYIFDHVIHGDMYDNNRLYDHFQTYLAPLSSIQFAAKKRDVITLLEAIECEPDDDMSFLEADDLSPETTFIFAAYESVTPDVAPTRVRRPIQARSRPLTDFREYMNYSDKLANLLSKCRITCDKQSAEKHTILFNLATKKCRLANNQQTFVTESEYLFQMLLKIKRIYENIGDYLLEAEQFKEDFVKDADILASKLDDYYRCEIMLRSELTNLMKSIYEEHDALHKAESIKNLKYRSKIRSTILNQLLSLQHADGYDDSRSVEVLSQRRSSTFEVELREIIMNDGLTVRPPDDIKILRDYVGTLRPRRQHIKNGLIIDQLAWQEMYDELYIEPNDGLLKKLSTIFSTNFSLCSRFFRGYALREEVDQPYRRSNNLSYENIFGDIDLLVSQLHYPMACPYKLAECFEKIKSWENSRDIALNVISGTEKHLSCQDRGIMEMLEMLCTKVTSAIASNMDNVEYTVHCRLVDVPYESIDCKTLMQQMHFYGAHHEHLFLDTDVVAIYIYAYFVRLFTDSPIILDYIMEDCDEETVQTVVAFLADNIPDRFALVRNPNPSPNDNGSGPQSGGQQIVVMDVDDDDDRQAENDQNGHRNDNFDNRAEDTQNDGN